ncbi:ribonuclease HII [Nitrococcus mobilis]|uniref:Ribonuclease HII n=1 Tax=Nitrococcus mobilis Nb-231 TaxID=314278 RepID=A4BS36_9GAMM|nr:ribonuclease HII [Nitrococcus mobilis]EAR21515.1 Ribonuclease H [Nitrococcus mobilis Nb-231]
MRPTLDFPAPAAWTAGIDEAGRGPLAGPVLAAAVILPPAPIAGIADSKRLSAARRSELATIIRNRAVGWAIGRAEVEEIDRLNILQASLLAMQRAVAVLTPKPSLALVDGRDKPRLPCRVEAIVGGDASVLAIGAASILAKVARDAEMIMLEQRYPGYGLARHKGYGTREHLAALRRLGPAPIHRRSFKPVRTLLGLGYVASGSARAVSRVAVKAKRP